MKGLNLSALSSRGRALESIHSTREQAAQAAALRSRLSKSELKSLRKSNHQSDDGALPTVDVLGSISAQVGFQRMAINQAGAPTIPISVGTGHGKSIATSIATRASASGLQRINSNTSSVPFGRVLGSNKLSLYQEVSRATPESRALPGANKYAEGARVSSKAFFYATTIIASIGGVLMGTVYYNPGVIDRLQSGTRRFRAGVEDGLLGTGLKGISDTMSEKKLSEDQISGAKEFAARVTKSIKSASPFQDI